MGARTSAQDSTQAAVRASTVPPATNFVRRPDGEHCADGAHVIFIGDLWASSTMRGQIPALMLNQISGRLHGVRASFLRYNQALTVGGLLPHVASFGPPSICVEVKQFRGGVRRACQKLGAVTLLDCIDGFDCFLPKSFATMRLHDAILVQTTEQARLLQQHNITAEVHTPRHAFRTLVGATISHHPFCIVYLEPHVKSHSATSCHCHYLPVSG